MTGQLAVPRILWAALFFSTLIYVAVLELRPAPGEPRWEALVFPLLFAGATTAGASLLAPRIMKSRRPSERTSPDAASKDAPGAYLVALIVALALAESVAIFGLVLGFLGAPPSVVMPFFAVAWVLMIIRFPTRQRWNAFHAS